LRRHGQQDEIRSVQNHGEIGRGFDAGLEVDAGKKDGIAFAAMDRLRDLGFARIDGGSGDDMLELDGSSLSLDLTDNSAGRLAGTKITGIETMDIDGTGANTLTLGLQDLLDLSETSNTLTILGGADDAVVADLTSESVGVSVGASSTTYTINSGAATLIVDNAVDQTGILVV